MAGGTGASRSRVQVATIISERLAGTGVAPEWVERLLKQARVQSKRPVRVRDMPSGGQVQVSGLSRLRPQVRQHPRTKQRRTKASARAVAAASSCDHPTLPATLPNTGAHSLLFPRTIRLFRIPSSPPLVSFFIKSPFRGVQGFGQNIGWAGR